jgi:hypothetical protein
VLADLEWPHLPLHVAPEMFVVQNVRQLR